VALYQVQEGQLQEIKTTSFVAESLRERQDMQRWLRDSPDALGERLFVIAEEYGDFEDARRRIDLLALDEEANLVVVELKRTDDGGFMDLQAIRYAAMISTMTFEDVVRAHETYLQRREISGVAADRILKFLGFADPDEVAVGKVPRIVLVSPEFSKEVTTTVLWLVERGLDIRCLQIQPYRLESKFFVDIHQVLPLEQAADYQVRIRQKDESAIRAVASRRELTLHVLARHGLVSSGTEIEVVPEALPSNASSMDTRVFKATIFDLSSRESVTWQIDGKHYSPTALTRRLATEHGLIWRANNIFIHWRIVGSAESMWEKAEQLTRGKRDIAHFS
jgi:hypothetical protein